MAYLMFQYDRPTDTRNWNNYNRHVQDWIAQLLTMPGAISFMAYRAAHQNSPDTFTLLEFRTMEEALGKPSAVVNIDSTASSRRVAGLLARRDGQGLLMA